MWTCNPRPLEANNNIDQIIDGKVAVTLFILTILTNVQIAPSRSEDIKAQGDIPGMERVGGGGGGNSSVNQTACGDDGLSN